MLRGVPVRAVSAVWPEVKPFVERCFRKAREHRYTADDVREMLVAGDAQLWIEGASEISAVVITQVQVFPRAKECVVFLTCGTLPDDWVQVLSWLVEGSKQLGCTHASAYVRPGFVKLLAGDWVPRQTYIVKELI